MNHSNWTVYTSAISGLAPIDSDISNYGGGRFSFDYKIENENGYLDIYIYKNGEKNTKPIELAKSSGWKTCPSFNIESDDNPRITIRARDSSQIYKVWIAFPPNAIENYAPSKPHLLQGPSEGFNDTYYDFSAMSEDPEGNRIKYIFDWGDGSISRTGWFSSGESVVETHSWNQAGTYGVMVTATDERYANNSSNKKFIAVSWLVKVPSSAPLQPLIDIIKPNTMLLLEGDVYDGPINITQSNVTVKSNNMHTNIRCRILDPNNYTIGIMNAKNVTISGLNISDGLYGIHIYNCSNCSILNSNILFKKCGINILGGNNYTIKENVIEKDGWRDASEDSVGVSIVGADDINILKCNDIIGLEINETLYYSNNSNITILAIKSPNQGLIIFNQHYHRFGNGRLIQCNNPGCSLDSIIGGCNEATNS